MEKPREKLDYPMPTPLQMEEIKWIIITSENAEEVFKKLGKSLIFSKHLASSTQSYSVGGCVAWYGAHAVGYRVFGDPPHRLGGLFGTVGLVPIPLHLCLAYEIQDRAADTEFLQLYGSKLGMPGAFVAKAARLVRITK